jgi:hypothetical protein
VGARTKHRLVFVDRLLAILVDLRYKATHNVLACWLGRGPFVIHPDRWRGAAPVRRVGRPSALTCTCEPWPRPSTISVPPGRYRSHRRHGDPRPPPGRRPRIAGTGPAGHATPFKPSPACCPVSTSLTDSGTGRTPSPTEVLGVSQPTMHELVRQAFDQTADTCIGVLETEHVAPPRRALPMALTFSI